MENGHTYQIGGGLGLSCIIEVKCRKIPVDQLDLSPKMFLLLWSMPPVPHKAKCKSIEQAF